MIITVKAYDPDSDQYTYTVDGVEKQIGEEDAFGLYEDLYAGEESLTKEQTLLAKLYKQMVQLGGNKASDMVGMTINE